MSTQPPLTPAEQAAAEAILRHFGDPGHGDLARAVVAAVRPATWHEAAAFLRSIADEPGLRHAADILDNAARESLSRPTSKEQQ